MKQIFLIVLLFCISIPLQAQKSLGDFVFPACFKTSKTSLQLKGAGAKKKFGHDFYVLALYVTEPSRHFDYRTDEPMSIRLHIASSLITSEKMIEAVEEGFERSAPEGISILRSRISEFVGLYREEIKKGDVFDLLYYPGTGTTIIKNGKVKATIKGNDFKSALFGIWLGENTGDPNLRLQLLSKNR